MKTLLLAAFASAFWGTTTVIEWHVDLDGVKINWELPAEKESGSMNGLDATIFFDPSNLNESKMKAKVDPNTINTGNTKRDAHLKGADFFDVSTYPSISFSSNKIEGNSKGKFIVYGDLFVKDTKNKVEIPFSFSESSKGATFIGSLELNTKAVGIDYGKISSADIQEHNCIVSIVVPVLK